jgi:hypothetical protein
MLGRIHDRAAPPARRTSREKRREAELEPLWGHALAAAIRAPYEMLISLNELQGTSNALLCDCCELIARHTVILPYNPRRS